MPASFEKLSALLKGLFQPGPGDLERGTGRNCGGEGKGAGAESMDTLFQSNAHRQDNK